MTVRSAHRASLAAGLALLAVGCAIWNAPLPREPGLHPQLTRYGYIEEGRLVSLLVDTEAARRREQAKMIPFGVGVANIGLDRLTLTRESFTLIDDAGRRYPMASMAEARAAGLLTEYDRTLSADARAAFLSRFSYWPFVRSAFFPRVERGLARDHIQLPRRSATYDVLYFPHPEGRLVGRRYELWMDTAELSEAVFVKFAVK